MWLVKLKPNLKTYPLNLSISPSILSSLINSLCSPVGITTHSDTSSTVDFWPTWRTKCHVSVNPICPALWTLALSIDNHYWEWEEETCREHGGQSSEKKTDKPQNQPSTSSSNRNSQNKHHKKMSTPHNSGSSAQNSEKKMSDLGDKLGKDGKLMAIEQAHHFANNLCLFCGGVGHTAKAKGHQLLWWWKKNSIWIERHCIHWWFSLYSQSLC